MTSAELQQLLADVRAGTVDPEAAGSRIVALLREAPFQDLGFARVDTHRELRQGFPEVILGLGKTPAQVAAIAERIVSNGQALLVTRATPGAFAAVQARLPAAVYHDVARVISLAQGELPQGRGTVLVVCAGTSDLPVAEEAAVTASLMGNCVDRLYDVGVA